MEFKQNKLLFKKFIISASELRGIYAVQLQKLQSFIVWQYRFLFKHKQVEQSMHLKYIYWGLNMDLNHYRLKRSDLQFVNVVI